VKVAEDFFRPEIDATFTGIAMRQFDDRDALRPEEEEKRNNPQPDGDAAVGTTLRLNTATTNSSTRSRRPRARIKCGWASDWIVEDIPRGFVGKNPVIPNRAARPGEEPAVPLCSAASNKSR